MKETKISSKVKYNNSNDLLTVPTILKPGLSWRGINLKTLSDKIIKAKQELDGRVAINLQSNVQIDCSYKRFDLQKIWN